MPDFIPSNDDQFNAFFTALNAYVQDKGDDLGLSAAQTAALDSAHAAWVAAWNAWQAEQNTYNALLATRNDKRAAATVLIRQVNAIAQADPSVTDTQRSAAGLPVHKTTRTASPVPETHPVLYRVDNEHLLQRLWFSDQDTPGSKAKPEGVGSCEIRQSLVAPGGAAPTDPNAMPYLATDSKTPHRTDLEPGDVGKTAYYCQRWVNKTQQPGPWGPVTGYPVV